MIETKRVKIKKTCFMLGGMGTIVNESIYQGNTTYKIRMDDGRIIYKDRESIKGEN